MRHLLSLLLSVIITPLIYITSGYAQVKWTESTDTAWTGLSPALYALPAIVVAGLLYAVLVLVRLSPLGPFLAGVVFLGAGMWSLFAATSLTDLMPDRFLGVNGILDTPANGFGPAFVIIGIPLVLTVFSPRRWRRYPNGAPAAGLSYSPDTVSAAPDYIPPTYEASGYSGYSGYGSNYTPTYSSPTYVPPSSATTDSPRNTDEPPTRRDSFLDGPTTPVVPTQATPPDEER
jgi:hypothetical protein